MSSGDGILEGGDGEGAGGSGVENVSRSGRVRKKNSLLAAYESLPDEIEKPKKKGERVKRDSSSSHSKSFGVSPSKSKPGRKSLQGNKRMKMTPSSKHGQSPLPPKLMSSSFVNDDREDGDLEMNLSPEFDDEMLSMPNLAVDESGGGYSSSDIDDRTNGHGRISVKKKSQAQSTYMMEKEKSSVIPSPIVKNNKKSTGHVASTLGKTVKKEKGTTRVTAYTLWSKDQREFYTKKYPHLDSSSLSKKLSEIWQNTIPPNQRKMWKNKADKIMRKNLNIKNSAPIIPPLGKGKKRGRPRIHPIANSKSNDTTTTTTTTFNNGTSSTPPAIVHSIRRIGNYKPAKKSTTPLNNNSASSKPVTTGPGRKPLSGQKSFNGLGVNHFNLVTSPSPSTSSSTSHSFALTRQLSPRKDEDATTYKVTGTGPIDCAAHFALLGESLSIIGERLMDVERQPVSGSLSVLMDSLLCAITPLVVLTQQVPELNCIPPDVCTRLLDHIAYVMPGL